MPQRAFIGVVISICIVLFLFWLGSTLPKTPIQVTDPHFDTKPQDKVRCSDFPTQDDAQRYFTSHANISSLDRDHDGIVCESL